MPVQPQEENTGGDITDQVAKQSKDSTASDHPMHGKATAFDHKSKGPVQADLGEPASREELKARDAELNK